MQIKETQAALEATYNYDALQAKTDRTLADQGLLAERTAEQDEMKASGDEIQLKIDKERLAITSDSNAAQLLSQQAKVDSARAVYDLKKSELDALHVRAGSAGVLEDVPVEEGQQVTAGTNLCRVADPTHLMATIQVAETQAKDVAPGQKAQIDTRNGIVSGPRDARGRRGGQRHGGRGHHARWPAAGRRALGAQRRRHHRNRKFAEHSLRHAASSRRARKRRREFSSSPATETKPCARK
jgi:biotin carboxyl carrier protein